MERNLTVGGLPGTGTTTLCRILADRLAMPYTYAGGLFRAEAERRGMTLADFGALCEQDPEVDKALDGQQTELLRSGGQILEGRLSGWMAHRGSLPAHKVWLTCADDERFRRLSERDGGDAASNRGNAVEREASERARYQGYYGIDLADTSIYDQVLDSTSMSPESLADAVVEAYA